MLSKIECDEAEDAAGSEISMKSFAIKASMSKMVSEKIVGVKVFLAGGCREVFVIKDKIGLIDGFRRKAQEQPLVFCIRIRRGREERFEIEGVEIEVSSEARYQEKNLYGKTNERL